MAFVINKKQKIVTIGGGTGSFVLLSGLKKLPVELSAIVSMADDGGSTGVLRDELGVLPPGDVRQCLVALSRSSEALRELFNYRYTAGKFYGHSFGNLFLSTLEKTTGSFSEAIKQAGEILRIRGRVIPVTLTNTKLIADLKSGMQIRGQHNVETADLTTLKKMSLRPRAQLNPEAAVAIKRADKIVINPGNLFASITPCLLVDGLAGAIKESRAKKIYVCNLMTKAGHTNGFTTIDFLENLEKYLGRGTIKYVIYNSAKLKTDVIKKYLRNKENFVSLGIVKTRSDIKFIGKNVLSGRLYQPSKSDKLARTIVRHDSDKIAKLIYNL